MIEDTFGVKILAEKLLKLNNSQQSIESLSRWCISHRKKAKQIVETWQKSFNSSQKEQCVSFLFLANDILQNSRRKGNEFVNEFWIVLPAALKHVYENGDENGKKAATRLVTIWEERKVFGSRGKSLKDVMLGKDPPPTMASSGKSSNLIKIVKRDAQSVRIKLAAGALPEKIITAFQSVLENLDEEGTLMKCNAAVCHFKKLEENLQRLPSIGDQQESAMVDELEKQEDVLQQCVRDLESMERNRAALILQLEEAKLEQELKLEHLRTQLQAAREKIEQASNIRKRLMSPSSPGPLPTPSSTVISESLRVVEQNFPFVHCTNSSQPHLAEPSLSFAPSKLTEEETKKAAAAAVAAKLAASTSSAQMLTSVLSSLVAEEAASRKSGGFIADLPVFPPQKRHKLDTPLTDGNNPDMGNTAYMSPLQQQHPVSNVPVAPSSSMQPISQANQVQAPYPPSPSPSPSPLSISHANPTSSQFVQSAGLMGVVMPFGYGGNPLPPPPPLPPHIAVSLGRPTHSVQQSQPPPQTQQQAQSQQQPANGGYYRPPGFGFYGQNQPATPPLHRQ